MRLDHLLSTEFSGRRLGVRRAAHASGTVPGFAWACWCGRDRWLRGFLFGVRGVVRICFWVPGPPPATWSRAVFRMSPWGGRPAGVPCPDRFLGAWWFENWIVDASNAMIFLSSFALSRFRQALLFGVWFRDRSFCDHCLQCDDLSSGVEKLIIRVFRGVCRPEGRMVDALADSTDEGRLRMR